MQAVEFCWACAAVVAGALVSAPCAGRCDEPARIEAAAEFHGPLRPAQAPEDNPQSDAKVGLGAQLFFDPRLSGDGKVSCATCHDPKKGYVKPEPGDKGMQEQKGTRNSQTIVNAGHMRFLFWDGRADSLEAQALGSIESPAEMGESLDMVVARLDAIPGYATQFKDLFGTGVTAGGMGRAIAAFERTIESGPSQFDRYRDGDAGAMSDAAIRGLVLFEGKADCGYCHTGALFSDQRFHNLGVGIIAADIDLGRERVTREFDDRASFRTPSLRNVAQTAPYFHDGSARTLLDAVEFIAGGGVVNRNRDIRIQILELTDQEKKDLVAFLESLSGPVPVLSAPPLPPSPPPAVESP